jgi:DNA-binding NtrC family response regulator
MSRLDNVAVFPKAADFDAESIAGPLRAKHIVFVDPSSRELLELLDRVAPSDASVQIHGDTGTGKELVARHIHRKSGRTGPFLAVNCGAISEHLAESELFGHESGAFTGAQARREGWFEAAHGGTLFLDEIGDLPLALQGKLLRVLQEGEVTRIGSRKSTAVDVRVISASNVDLAAAMAQGKFRRDLFYRLNIVPVRLAPLRDRPGDIAALATHFIATYSQRLTRPAPSLHHEALDALRRYPWPGNIRELENVIHFSLLLTTGNEIRTEHLRLEGEAAVDASQSGLSRIRQALRECFDAPGSHLLRDVERRLIEDAYRHCNSNQVRTADLLGISRNVVRTLLKRYGLLIDTEGTATQPMAFLASGHRPESVDSCREVIHGLDG